MKLLYDMFYMIPISILLVLFGGVYVGMPKESILGCIGVVLLSALVIYIRHATNKKRWCCIGIVVVFSIALFIILGETRREWLYQEYGWMGWNICFTGLAFVMGLVIEKWKLVRRSGAVLLFVGLLVTMVKQWEISRVATVVAIFLILISLVEDIQGNWKKSGYADKRTHSVMTAPILLLLCICVLLMPASAKPYDWNFVKNLYQHVSRYMNQVSGYLLYPSEEYGVSGFSIETDFFGALSKNEQKVLRVSVDKNNTDNLYLIGAISEEFDGREWVFKAKSDNERMMDMLETTYAIRKLNYGKPTDFMRKTTVTCENLLYNTHFVFAPAKTRIETMMTDNPEFEEKNHSLLTKKRLKYEDVYESSCYILNYENPSFEQLLSEAQPVTESDWGELTKGEYSLNNPSYSYDAYLDYKENIYETCCDTDGVSDEVAQLLNDIKENSDSDYEEMKQLEEYLKSMEYSVSPGKLPKSVTDGKTFLDYMLLESKKGYCVHYATTFVLLARELGMPARYVQGYYVERNSMAEVIVTQGQAHAWPEVYFEHVGWIAFEPTPGYVQQRGWIVQDGASQHNKKNKYENSDNLEVQNEQEEDTNNEEKEEKVIHIELLLFPIAGVLLFLVLFFIISRIIARRGYKCLQPEDKLAFLTNANIRLLGKLGYKLKKGETLEEYGTRIGDELEAVDIDFIISYEEFLYADAKVTKEQIVKAEQTYKVILDLLKKKKWYYMSNVDKLSFLLTRKQN